MLPRNVSQASLGWIFLLWDHESAVKHLPVPSHNLMQLNSVLQFMGYSPGLHLYGRRRSKCRSQIPELLVEKTINSAAIAVFQIHA